MRRTCLALILLACSCGTSYARQLSDLRADARALAKDAGATRQRFTDASLTSWLNEAQRLLIARSWCMHKSFEFELVAGTTYYALPANYLAARRLTWEHLQLQEMSPAAMDGKSREWETASGTPNYYFINFSSRGYVGFAPWPGATSDTGTIRMDYFAMPTDMSADSALPFDSIGEFTSYHHALPYYAAAKMSAIDGRDSVAQLYLGIFDAYQKTMVEKCFDRPNYSPSASGRSQ